jgi:hypothetical protein
MTHVTPEPVPTGNPMLDVLRARHPEVDIVVLPDPVAERAAASASGTAIPEAPAISPATVAQTAESLIQDLMARLGRQPAWQEAEVERGVQWHRTPEGYRYVESVVAVGGLEPGANIDLLRATGAAMQDLGWLARPASGTRPRLVARRGPFRATAVARPDGLVVTITSGLLAGAGPGGER